MSKAVTRQRPTTDATTEGCPECAGEIVTDGDEQVCGECGLVVEEDRIDRGPEWRAYTADEEAAKRRVGPPANVGLHDGGKGSEIGSYRDARGDYLADEKRHRLARQRTLHGQAKHRSKADRNRRDGLIELHRMASALGVGTSQRAQACQLFKTAQDEMLFLGRTVEAFSAAAIYAVDRINEGQLLVDDAVAVARVSEERIRNAYDALRRELELPVPPREPAAFIGRICSALEAGGEDLRRAATELATAVTGTHVTSGCNPAGVAAGCVYVAAKSRTDYRTATQAEIGEAAGVSPQTVRYRARDVEEVIGDAE